LQQKLAEVEDQFAHGQRETRAQLQVKNKEILNQREELDELQSKHNSKS
jgi:chromosome segregation ATPase